MESWSEAAELSVGKNESAETASLTPISLFLQALSTSRITLTLTLTEYVHIFRGPVKSPSTANNPARSSPRVRGAKCLSLASLG